MDQEDKISISKQVILENDEFYQVSDQQVNADLMHLEPIEANKQAIGTQEEPKISGSIEDFKDFLKESTDLLQAPSPSNLEYSRSMNQIEAEQTPLGGDESCLTTGERRMSQTSSGLRHISNLIEKTPKFHGSSPVILEQTEENVSTMEAA